MHVQFLTCPDLFSQDIGIILITMMVACLKVSSYLVGSVGSFLIRPSEKQGDYSISLRWVVFLNMTSYIPFFTLAKSLALHKDFFGKCEQMHSKLRIWSHLLKKSSTESFIFCAVQIAGSSDFYLKYIARDLCGNLSSVWTFTKQ